jgi:tRNA(adenine34) deaminase
MTETDTHFMERCKALAAIAADRGESPVGSVVVLGDDIIAEGIEAGKSRQDVTFHAEVEAVREAVRKHGKDLSAATLYTTHEPCILCSYVIRPHRIGRVVIQTAVAYTCNLLTRRVASTLSNLPNLTTRCFFPSSGSN